MAISNVKSSEYRSAGGRAWNRVKVNTRLTNDKVDEAEYLKVKAAIRAELANGYDEALVTVCEPGKRSKRKSSKKVVIKRGKFYDNQGKLKGAKV